MWEAIEVSKRGRQILSSDVIERDDKRVIARKQLVEKSKGKRINFLPSEVLSQKTSAFVSEHVAMIEFPEPRS